MNPIAAEGAWHVGYLVGVALFGVLTLASLAGVVFFAICRHKEPSSYDKTDWTVAVVTSAIAALVCAGLLALCAFPFDTTFHKYYRVEGKVEQISDRLVPAGKGMQQRFVVVIDGQPFGVDDTRASLLKPGQNVVLQCSRDYQYAGDSGYVCEWGQQR